MVRRVGEGSHPTLGGGTAFRWRHCAADLRFVLERLYCGGGCSLLEDVLPEEGIGWSEGAGPMSVT